MNSYKYTKSIAEYFSLLRFNVFERLEGKRSFKNSKKLSLIDVTLLIVMSLHRSLQLELSELAVAKGCLSDVASKSAFIQSRGQLGDDYFPKMHEEVVSLLSLEKQILPRAGFRRVGVDGTPLYLPQTKELAKRYGTNRNQHGGVVMGLGLVAYNIESGYIEKAELGHLKLGERAIMQPWLDDFSADTLLIYDRLYLGFEFAYEHNIRNRCFLMRGRKNWNNVMKAFIASDLEEEIVEIKVPGKTLTKMRKKDKSLTGKLTITLRLVKGKLENGDMVVYATNVLDSERLTKEEVHEDYACRWQTETAIDALKNKWQIQNFSGHKVKHIQQDFHAAIIAYNLSKSVYNKAQKKLDEVEKEKAEESGKERTPKQINHNLCIGICSRLYLELWHPEYREETMLEQVVDFLVRFPEPVRLGRSFKRKKKRFRGGKYIFFFNYKKAV